MITMQRADRSADASAISGDPIDDSTTDPLRGGSKPGPEKIHPNPAVSLSLFQAASVKQETRLLSVIVLGRSRDRSIGFCGKLFLSLAIDCTVDHSLANLIPFRAVSFGER